MRMLHEPRQRADGLWYWGKVFRPRGCAEPFIPRPVLPSPPPFAMKRVAALVHLACIGVDDHVSFGG